jgi:hypothetical protein
MTANPSADPADPEGVGPAAAADKAEVPADRHEVPADGAAVPIGHPAEPDNEPPNQIPGGGAVSRGKRRARAITLLVILAVVVLFPAWGWSSSPAKPMSCTFPGIPQQAAGSPPALPATYKPAKLVLISGQTTTLEFNRALATKTLTIQYGISGAATGTIPDSGANQFPQLQAADPLGFIRDDQEPLPGGRVSVASWVQNGRVLLKVCVQRSGPGFADPGTYQGTVSIVDPRVGRVDVPVVVTLSYSSWQWIMALLVAAVLVGAWYVWVLQAKTRAQIAIGWGFVDFYATMLGVLSAGAGVVAAFGVYTATYLNSTTWGSSSTQVFALFGAMFGAFLAGATTVHIGAKAGQADSNPAEAARGAEPLPASRAPGIQAEDRQ